MPDFMVLFSVEEMKKDLFFLLSESENENQQN